MNGIASLKFSLNQKAQQLGLTQAPLQAAAWDLQEKMTFLPLPGLELHCDDLPIRIPCLCILWMFLLTGFYFWGFWGAGGRSRNLTRLNAIHENWGGGGAVHQSQKVSAVTYMKKSIKKITPNTRTFRACAASPHVLFNNSMAEHKPHYLSLLAS